MKIRSSEFTVTWMLDETEKIDTTKMIYGEMPTHADASKEGYIFTGWRPALSPVKEDITYTAAFRKRSNGGGSAFSVNGMLTYSPNWYRDAYGVWRIRNSAGQTVVNAWLCDDFIAANGKNVWYLLGTDGAMIANGLVQDNTGNFYSLETEHNGYFGSVRYKDGYYNCNGQQVYLRFSKKHDGTFGAVLNADGLGKLKAIYGVTKYGIGNENSVYTATF